jgi:pyruvate dehydrogenase E1 component alpha subunit/2-oxoisovalerate dehydrogenase E1 component alpha subunit
MQATSETAPRSPRPRYAYFDGSERDKALGLFQIVDDRGKADPSDVAHVDRAEAIKMWLGMKTIRVVDARMIALQRQGRISFYGSAIGQEAAVVGSAAALEPDDWLVPALREAGAGIYRGLSLASYVAQIFGNAADVTKGRQMPCHPCDRETNYVVMSSCVASQLPHAVGIAMAMKLAGDHGRVCMGYMGDGGTSEPDFHVALNFAGVSKAPVVLVCQNNQWAISTPASLQTASETIAIKGTGYGIESLRADGNDILAVNEVSRYAVDKARRGEGPTFIELLTYRVSAHTTSDDPSRYRDESVTEVWREQRDPLDRFELFCKDKGWLSDVEIADVTAELDGYLAEVVDAAEKIALPDAATLVDDVFEQIPWHLVEQRDFYLGAAHRTEK